MVLRLAATLLLLAGCSSLGVRTEGTSGPIAWHVQDIAVVTRENQGRPYTGQTFTVVLKNVSDRTITFRKYDETRYAPGINPLMRGYTGAWTLGPGQEWKIDRFNTVTCNYGGGCVGGGSSQMLGRFVFTGEDDQGRPVEVTLDLTLPPAATGPTRIR